jgi:thiol-disulfide isomerase/thioredoxin
VKLPKPTLGNAITGMFLIGVLAVLYVIISALVTTERGPLDAVAVGTMSEFRTLSDAPGQPLNELRTGSGETVTLADRRGKVTLVNFWATWCAPCVIEMPYLNELQGRYGSDDFEVITVSMDRQFEDAERFFEEHQLTHLELYFDPSMSIAFSVMGPGSRGLPLTILYDRNGREIGRVSFADRGRMGERGRLYADRMPGRARAVLTPGRGVHRAALRRAADRGDRRCTMELHRHCGLQLGARRRAPAGAPGRVLAACVLPPASSGPGVSHGVSGGHARSGAAVAGSVLRRPHLLPLASRARPGRLVSAA